MTEERSATLTDMSYVFLIELPAAPAGTPADPVGVLEVAARLGVEDRSVHQWLHRNRLPAADYETVNGSRAWEWRKILWWAGETNRLRSVALGDEYRATFHQEPVDASRTRQHSTVPSTAPIVELVDKHKGRAKKPSVPA